MKEPSRSVIRNRSYNHRENNEESREHEEDGLEHTDTDTNGYKNNKNYLNQKETKKQRVVCLMVLSGLIILLICSLSICYSIIDLVGEISSVRKMNLFSNISTPLEGINRELKQLDIRFKNLNVSSHLEVLQDRFEQLDKMNIDQNLQEISLGIKNLEKMNIDQNLQGIYLELKGLQSYNISRYLSQLQELQQKLQKDLEISLQKELQHLGLYGYQLSHELTYWKMEWKNNLLPLLKTINVTLFDFNNIITSSSVKNGITKELDEFTELNEINENNDLNNNINTDVNDNRPTNTNSPNEPLNFDLNGGF